MGRFLSVHVFSMFYWVSSDVIASFLLVLVYGGSLVVLGDFVVPVEVGGGRGPLASHSRPIFGETGCNLYQKMRIVLENIIPGGKEGSGVPNGQKFKKLMTVGFEPTRFPISALS